MSTQAKKSSLFIIGNGFDSAHNLKTLYDDFKQWLLNNLDSKGSLRRIASYSTFGINQFDYDLSLASSSSDFNFVFNTIDIASKSDWNIFESALGEIEWQLFFDNEVYEQYDKEGDLDLSKTLFNLEMHKVNLGVALSTIPELFSEWVDTINTASAIRNPFLTDELIKNCNFLTFNYTDTLEKTYNIPTSNICHIHGKQGSNIIIGHGNDEEIYYETPDSRYNLKHIDTSDLSNALRKNTQEILHENIDFFKSLSHNNLQNIYSWGFSFSSVDCYYIRWICSNLDTSQIIFYLNDFNDEYKKYIPLLRDCGFKGSFSTFNTDTIPSL